MPFPKTARRRGCLAVVVVLVACVALVAGFGSFRRPFESGGWKAATGQGLWGERNRMVDDLLARKLLLGRSRSEVESLLGPPESTNYFSSLGYAMMYRVGPGRGWLPGPSYLAIRFDDAGRVAVVDELQD